ncbi:MAG: thioredoxin domain-containing protein [Bacteroidota bacterium]
MSRYLVTATFYCLLTCITYAVYADTEMNLEVQTSSIQSDAARGMDDEYEKLLRIIEKKRAPVQSLDGALNIKGRPGMGPKDSDVILVEFGDFQCAYCRRHLLGAAQQIHEKLVLTNQLRYVFLDFPLGERHPLAAKAAVAARCAEEQEKYWEMRNTLYNNQKALHELFLVEHAKGTGMDEVAFSRCLHSGRYEAAIQQDQVVGRSLGIKGTPTFFLGINNGDEIKLVRKIQGVQPYELFEREILYAVDIAKKQHESSSQIIQSGM